MTSDDLEIIDSGADFSADRKYRYSLWRVWDKSLPKVMYIGLNPSTANEIKNDPTVKSCMRIAKSNGYGGIYMMNCYAFISTDPKLLILNPAEDELNNVKLKEISEICETIVFAWGNFEVAKSRGLELLNIFPDAMALTVNKSGSPKHPLYCKSDTKFIKYNL